MIIKLNEINIEKLVYIVNKIPNKMFQIDYNLKKYIYEIFKNEMVYTGGGDKYIYYTLNNNVFVMESILYEELYLWKFNRDTLDEVQFNKICKSYDIEMNKDEKNYIYFNVLIEMKY